MNETTRTPTTGTRRIWDKVPNVIGNTRSWYLTRSCIQVGCNGGVGGLAAGSALLLNHDLDLEGRGTLPDGLQSDARPGWVSISPANRLTGRVVHALQREPHTDYVPVGRNTVRHRLSEQLGIH